MGLVLLMQQELAVWAWILKHTNWNSYRYYGQKDVVQNNWTMRTGGQYYPAKENTATRKYWSFVKYRAGFYYGPDYIKLNKNLTNYAGTIGASFPLTSVCASVMVNMCC